MEPALAHLAMWGMTAKTLAHVENMEMIANMTVSAGMALLVSPLRGSVTVNPVGGRSTVTRHVRRGSSELSASRSANVKMELHAIILQANASVSLGTGGLTARFHVKEEDMGLVVPTGVITAVGKTLMVATLSLANADVTRDGEA